MFDLSQAITESPLLPFVLDLTLKSTLVLLLACVAARFLQNASAALRHLVWSTALGGILLLPVLSWALPSWRVTWWPELMSAQAVTAEPVLKEDVPLQSTAALEAVALSVVPLPRETAAAMRQQLLTPAPTDAAPVTVAWWRRLLNRDWKQSLLWCWLAGLLFVMARVGLGTVRLWWLTRGAWQITDGSWLRLAQRLATRLRLRREIALLKSGGVSVPLTWGAWRSVVVLPAEADAWSDGCRSVVLLHELAHVKRRDCLTQLLAQVACALYWFNPLVWLAARRLREERELACDNHVLDVGTKASEYANYLVEIASALRGHPETSPVAVGMACSQLENRVQAILDPHVRRGGLTRRVILSAAVLLALLLAPLAMVRPWQAAQAAAASALDRDESSEAATSLELTSAMPARAKHHLLKSAEEDTVNAKSKSRDPIALPQDGVRISETIEDNVQQTIKHEVREHLKQEVTQRIEYGLGQGFGQGIGQGSGQGSGQGVGQAVGQSVSSSIRLGVGFGIGFGLGRGAGNGAGTGQGQGNSQSSELTLDQIIQMKTHHVTPEFIETMRRAGFENLSVRQAVEFRIHGVDEAYVKQVRGWGFDKATARDLVQLRVAGVTADYLAALKQLGFENLSLNRVAQMRLHGVTPEFVESMRRQGFDKLTPDQVTSLRIHGVNEAYIKEVQALSGEKLSINDLLQFKISGVSPEYARQMKALGIDNVSWRKLSQMSLHGVTESYVREMRGLGFENLTADQLLKMRIHGVTPDYVKKLRAAGLKNVSVNQMIEMRIHGIDDILLKGSR
jgi:beta-lactamase regulating signal transducer with metallopeptidase domain